MNVADESGITKREHLLSVERQTGKRPAGLDGPECPAELRYLIEWFIELSVFRRAGFAAPERISPLDIAGYALLTGQWPKRWETQALAKLDIAFLESQAVKTPKRQVAEDMPSRRSGKTRRG